MSEHCSAQVASPTRNDREVPLVPMQLPSAPRDANASALRHDEGLHEKSTLQYSSSLPIGATPARVHAARGLSSVSAYLTSRRSSSATESRAISEWDSVAHFEPDRPRQSHIQPRRRLSIDRCSSP